MDVRMDLGAGQIAAPMITHRQIAAVRLLQLPSQELEAAVVREQVENPALDAEVRPCCPRCSTPLAAPGAPCPGCGARGSAASDPRDDYDEGESSGLAHAEEDDPVLRVPGTGGRGETLLHLLRMALPARDAALAEYLVGNLDSHGYLPQTIVADAVAALRVSRKRAEAALEALQQLDPPGIGARGARECLLLQLRRLREAGAPRPLAERLVEEHLNEMAFRRFPEVARQLALPTATVEAEWRFVQAALHPYPAHGFAPETAGIAATASTIRPDVAIRETEHGLAVEVVERNRYALQVNPEYLKARRRLAGLVGAEGDQEHVRQHIEQAQAFISALRQRWDTMHRVTEVLIARQRAFLESGPAALRPLTRADVGAELNLHESTVSRATDGKFVLLPNGRTVPFDDFFDGSLPIRQAITVVLSGEDPRYPYSDEQLTRLLARRGIVIARRTVAKYREEMGILPSRMRRQRPLTRTRRRAAKPELAPVAAKRA